MISEVVAAGRYTGNGVTASFVYPFLVTNQGHLAVYVDDELKVVGTHYTVSGVGNATGSVTFFAGSIPAIGAKVTILRDQPLEQTSDYVLNEGFPSARVEQDLDKLAMQAQMIDERIKRAVKFSRHSALTDIDFPEPETGKYLRAKVGGFELVELTNSAVVDLVAGDVKVVSNYASFAAAVTAIGATVTTLYVNQAVTASTAITTPTTLHIVVIGSGSFTKSGSGTLTFNGPVEAPLKQVFSGFAAGDVTFGAGSIKSAYPQWWGAKGDGTTDDTTAITAATASYGHVSFVVGKYRTTAKISMAKATTLEGMGASSGSSVNATTSIIYHDFNGDLFEFTGTSGDNLAGAGGGIKDLVLMQRFGNGLAAAGRAIVVKATSDTHFPSWLRFENVQIERDTGKDDWTWGIYIDGRNAATIGVPDTWIDKCRIVSGTNATGSIYLDHAIIVFISNSEMNLSKGNIVATGASGLSTNGVYISNTNASILDLDWAQNVRAIGGAFSEVKNTINTLGSNLLLPSAVSTDFINNQSNSTYLAYHDSTVGAWRHSDHILFQNNRGIQGRSTTGVSKNLLRVGTDNTSRLDEDGLGVKVGSSIKSLTKPDGSLIVEVVATASLPAAGTSQDGKIIIEDGGGGVGNLILYKGGQRFRLTGTAFS